jgi:hypothetical protein
MGDGLACGLELLLGGGNTLIVHTMTCSRRRRMQTRDGEFSDRDMMARNAANHQAVSHNASQRQSCHLWAGAKLGTG